MKLIRELAEGLDYIEEAVGDKKHLVISGIFVQAGVVNRNGRMYPPPVLEREVNRYVKEKVDARCAYGELGHPNGPALNPDRISHVITEMKQDPKSPSNWIGRARVIDEGMCKIVKGVIEAGGRWGISSRGLGTLRKDPAGHQVVNDDYRLMVGGDIVTDPSAPDAWLNGIMESTEWFLDERSGEWKSRVVESTRQDLRRMPAKKLHEQKAKLFENFISRLQDPTNARIKALAEQANVSQDRVRELWDRQLRDGTRPTLAAANVRKILGL